MRLFARSATNSRFLESMARLWGWSNSLGPVPRLPHCLMNFPVRSNLRMRPLPPPWPSETKMSPFGAVMHVVRLVEVVRLAGAAGLAQREEHLALRAELEHLMSARRAGKRRRTWCRRWSARCALSGRRSGRGRAAARAAATSRCRCVVLAVGDPDVPVAVHVDAVREDQQALAEAPHQLARFVELEHRRRLVHLSGRAVEAAVGAASLGDPDRLAVRVDVHRARRTPRAALGELGVVLDGLIRVRQVVGRRDGSLSEGERSAGHHRHRCDSGPGGTTCVYRHESSCVRTHEFLIPNSQFLTTS